MSDEHAISRRPDSHTAIMDRPTFDSSTGMIEIPTPFAGGKLIFDPKQKVFTPEQMVLLDPLGIKANWSVPHVIAFLAECSHRGLDPWAREAFLMLYPGEKYVRHIGIAGFLRRAHETGQFEGLDPVEFAGPDGQFSEFWPAPAKAPYAARVTAYRKGMRPVRKTIYYDEYAPLTEDKVWDPTQKRKVSTGKGMVPVPMWQTAHLGGKVTVMLGKCVQAAALRQLFPDQFNGFYEPAEFDKTAQDLGEWDANDGDVGQERRDAYREATEGTRPGPVVDGEIVSTLAAPPADEPAGTDLPLTLAAARHLLLAELDAQARLLGMTRETITRKWSMARGGADLAQASLSDIAAHVGAIREYVIGHLREQRRGELADRYADATRGGQPRPLVQLFGTAAPWDVPEDPAGPADQDTAVAGAVAA